MHSTAIRLLLVLSWHSCLMPNALSLQLHKHNDRLGDRHYRRGSKPNSVHNWEQTERKRCTNERGDMTHEAVPEGWWMDKKGEETVASRKAAWQAVLADVPDVYTTSAANSSGRGVVYCAGPTEFNAALVSIRMLRRLGCTLPIELWHFPDELSEFHKEKLGEVGAVARDITHKGLYMPTGRDWSMWEPFNIKPAALLNTAFEDVIYLDSDNIPTRDPTYLFDMEQYSGMGGMFWGDFWKTDPRNPIYDIFEVDCYDEREFESGQMVINKVRAWQALHVVHHMNSENNFYYQLLFGDKDTFRFAFKGSNTPYHFVNLNQAEVGFVTAIEKAFCGHTRGHFDPDGRLLFLHFHLLKYKEWKGVYSDVQLRQGANGYSAAYPWTEVQQVDDLFASTWRPEWFHPIPHLKCLTWSLRSNLSEAAPHKPFTEYVDQGHFYQAFLKSDAPLLLVS